MISITTVILPIYQSAKSSVRGLISSIIIILNAIDQTLNLIVTLFDAVTSILSVIGNINLTIPGIQIPDGIGNIPLIGNLFQAAASVLNTFVNAINGILGVFNPIFNVCKQLVNISQTISSSVGALVTSILKINNGVINFLTYFQNNPGVVLYQVTLSIAIIAGIYPSGQVFIQAAPILWTVSGTLLLFCPLIFYWYFRVFQQVQVSGSGIDMAVVYTENTILFTDRGAQIFYPFIYLLILGAIYGVLLSNVAQEYILALLPKTLVICLYILPIIPVFFYLYSFCLQNTMTALINEIAAALNITPTDSRFAGILALQSPDNLTKTTATNLINTLTSVFNLNSTGQAALSKVKVLAASTSQVTMGFLSEPGEIDSLKSEIASALQISPSDSRWAAVQAVLQTDKQNIIQTVMNNIINTFGLNTSQQQTLSTLGINTLNFLANSIDQTAFKMSVQSALNIQSTDSRWNAALYATVNSGSGNSNINSLGQSLVGLMNSALASLNPPQILSSQQTIDLIAVQTTTDFTQWCTTYSSVWQGIPQGYQVQILSSFPVTSGSNQQIIDSQAYLAGQNPKVANDLKNATIKAFNLNRNDQAIISNLPTGSLAFLIDQNALNAFQTTVQNALMISNNDPKWGSVTLLNDTSNLQNVTSSQLKNQIIQVFNMTLDQQGVLLSIATLNLGDQGLGIVTVKNILAIDYVMQMLTDSVNQFIGIYTIGIAGLYELVNAPILDQFLQSIPGNIDLILQILPIIPALLWFYLMLIQKQDYRSAAAIVENTILFQNANFSIAYPFIYMILLGTYYEIISTTLFTTLLSQFPDFIYFVLYSVPLLPLFDYFYQLLTLNGVSLANEGFIGILQINAQSAINKTIADIKNFNFQLIVLYAYTLMAFYRLFANISDVINIFPQPIPFFIQTIPLIPLGVYSYARFWLKESNNDSVNLTIQTVTFNNMQVSIAYPVAYLILAWIYYGVLNEVSSTLVDYLPATISLALVLLPIVPVFLYLYRIINDPMYVLRSDVAAALDIDPNSLSNVAVLQSLSSINGRNPQSIILEISTDLQLSSDQMQALNNVPEFQIGTINTITFTNALTISGVVSDLKDRNNLFVAGYLLFLRGYFEILSLSLVQSIISLIPELLSSVIVPLLQLMPFIPLLIFIYFCITAKQVSHLQIVKTVQVFTDLLTNWQGNSDIITYSCITFFVILLSFAGKLFQVSDDTNLFIQHLLIFGLLLLLSPIVIFGIYYNQTKNIQSSITNTRMSVQALIQPNILYYLSFLFGSYSVYTSSTFQSILQNSPTALTIIIQIGLLATLIPIVLFFYSLYNQGNIQIALNAYTNLLSLSLPTISSTVSSSNTDLNPNLTQLERFFFGMLYADQPQNQYYNLNTSLLSQIPINNPGNFTQLYTLRQLNKEFFGSETYEINNYGAYDNSSVTMSRISYITLPLQIWDSVYNVTSQLTQSIQTLFGQVGVPLNNIPDQVILEYAYGYDSQNNPQVIQGATQISKSTPPIKQGINNRQFISKTINNINQTIINSNDIYNEIVKRINAYMKMFTPFLGTANLRSATNLESYVYTNGQNVQFAIISNQINIKSAINTTPIIQNTNLFNQIYRTLINELSGVSNQVVDLGLFYSMIIAELPIQSFATVSVNDRAIAAESLFLNTTNQDFVQLLNSQASTDAQSIMFNASQQLVNNFANTNTRIKMKTLMESAASSGLNQNQLTSLDGYFFSNFYQAALLLNQVYNTLYSIIGQFATNAKITDSLDMVAFRNSIAKFQWPTSPKEATLNRFIDIPTLINEIATALNLNSANTQALSSLPSLSGRNFDLLKSGSVTELELEIITMLNLNQTAGIKIDISQALQLDNATALKLNNVSLLNSRTIDVTNPQVMNDLKNQVINALGFNSQSNISSQLSSYLNLNSTDSANLTTLPSLGSHTLNIMDPTLINRIQQDLINFISSTNRIKNNIINTLQLNAENQGLLNTAASLQVTNIDLTNPNIKQIIQNDVQNALQLNSPQIMQARIVTALNLNPDQANQLGQLSSFSGTTLNLAINGVIDNIKSQISNLFNSNGIINCNDIKSYIINTLSLNSIDSTKINAVPLLNNATIDLSNRSNITALRSQILQTTQWSSTSIIQSNLVNILKLNNSQQIALNSILNTSTIDLTNVQTLANLQLEIINGLSLNSLQVKNLQTIPAFNPAISTVLSFSYLTAKCVNLSNVNKVPGLQDQAYNLLSFQDIRSQDLIIAAINNVPGLNPATIAALNLYNSPAMQCINTLNNIPSLSQASITQLNTQDTNQLSYWYKNFKNCSGNWLSLYNTDLVLDQTSGKPKEVGWQMGCPKPTREKAHNQLAVIFSNLEEQLGTVDSNGNTILSQVCQIIDLLSQPNQFIYEIIKNSEKNINYKPLVTQIDQYLSGFIDVNNKTMSLLSLLPAEYEYSHFIVNLPLNLLPIQIANLDTTLDANELKSILTQNICNNSNYIAQRNQIAQAFVMKCILDMTWWQQFVLWYYPLPEIEGKNYQNSGPIIQNNYMDIQNNLVTKHIWDSNPESTNRFKYTATNPRQLTVFDGSGNYNSTNATIDSTITLKQNPAVWIGNGCFGYGMQYLFASWANSVYNTTYSITMNYPCLSAALFKNTTSFDNNIFYQLVNAYRHDAMMSYIFVSVAPLTMNRFDENYSWQDSRKLAFTTTPKGGSNNLSDNFVQPNTQNPNDLYKIMFVENRKSPQLKSGDEYMSAMGGSIPSVFFNNNTTGPANAPYSPLFNRSCIDNLDFGNSLFYGISSLSSNTPNGYGNLAYSPNQNNLSQTNWNFGGNAGDIKTNQNNIISQEGQYYCNSLDWLMNRSSIGWNLTNDNNTSHLLAPLNPADMWNNCQQFLTDPISFFNLNKSYQLYPITLLPKVTQNYVTPENGTSVTVQIPNTPEFQNLAWIIPPNSDNPGIVPCATIISNTKWTTRFTG